jgi:aminopeptidase YwaD
MPKLKAFHVFLLLAFMLSMFEVSWAQQTDYARKVVNTLAAPEFKGRGYVENGDQLASAYIAAEFKKFGLQPLNKGSYFQDFNLAVNTFPGKVSVILNGKPLTPAVDYLVHAASPSAKGGYPVISVTRKSINSVEKLKAVLLRAAGAFILLDQRVTEPESADHKKLIDAHVEVLTYSENLNFKGLLLNTDQKLTWTTAGDQLPRPVIILHKKDLDPAQVKEVTLNIESKFHPAYRSRNVVAMVKGSSGLDSTLVLTAHYDHLGLMGKAVYFPGANDNASGVAMLLSLAQHYAKHQPKFNMIFIAFSGEEIGLLGSKAFVQQPLTDLRKIKFLINFDLAGTGDEGIKVVNGTKFRLAFDRLVALNAKHQLLSKVEIRGDACNSDHCHFYMLGIPSFFIYTQGGIKAYHDIYDRSETLPLTAFEPYFKLMIQFLNSEIH